MPIFTRDTPDGPVHLHYQVTGEGTPLLLLAPGGMRSAISFWQNAPWNPIEAMSADYQVIAMDQRNAGESRGPITAGHGWHTYTQDQVALLEHLQVDELLVGGMCIGGPYCMGLIQALTHRVRGAVLWQPIGLDENRTAFYEMFDSWAGELAQDAAADLSNADWTSFRSNMFDSDFLFNCSQAQVAACTTPLLVLCGADLYHPESTSRRIVELAPKATLIEHWKTQDTIAAARAQVADFCQRCLA